MAKYEATIKTLWGMAKSPELRMSDEELHLLIEANTGKESMKDLTKRDIRYMAGILSHMKDSASSGKARPKYGNPATENQRKKVYCLMQQLEGKKRERVNGLCKKLFRAERVEWLNPKQCSDLISALDDIVKREAAKKGGTHAG